VVPLLADNKGGSISAEFVTRLFYHLPGPKEVEIKTKDISLLNSAVDFLVWLGKFAAEFTNNVSSSKSSMNTLYELFVTALSYGEKKVVRDILDGIQEIMNAAYEGAKEDRKLLAVVTHAKKMEKKISKTYERVSHQGTRVSR